MNIGDSTQISRLCITIEYDMNAVMFESHHLNVTHIQPNQIFLECEPPTAWSKLMRQLN